MAKKSKRNAPSASHRRMVGATPDETHYLLIVHGTWNSYDRVLSTPQQKWYWSEEASSQLFVDQLRARLQGTELANAVWRKVPGIDWPFSWSGQNSHKARIAAAQELCKIMIQIVTIDPTARLHFVAHSHGGNDLVPEKRTPRGVLI